MPRSWQGLTVPGGMAASGTTWDAGVLQAYGMCISLQPAVLVQLASGLLSSLCTQDSKSSSGPSGAFQEKRRLDAQGEWNVQGNAEGNAEGTGFQRLYLLATIHKRVGLNVAT